MSSDAPDSPEERARMLALLTAMQTIVGDPDAPERLREDPRAWLAQIGVAGPDLDAMAGLDPKRLLLYRKLVRRGIADSVRRQIPRAAARLGPAWDAALDRFFNEELPRSHYLRDVAFEFVDFAASLWAADASVPAFVVDLARHELLAFEVSCEPRCAEPTDAPLDLERPARFDPAARLRRYEHAVHRLSADPDARDMPPREPTALLAYRDAEHDVRYLELTPLAAGVVERLLQGSTLRAAVTSACADLAIPMDDSVLASIAALLSDLAERGVLLGGESIS
ncbi:MAG: putative DNA-binding domain-containing protein [Polyangiaceae bacterium]|nr:putative DNA-binding domain-containing protein [Polyangiaceae bacterium]